MKSKYFTREEFACRCGCGKDTVDAELLELLDDVREHFSSPVMIKSGHMCSRYNKKTGGSIESKHLDGKAADIVVTGVSPFDVYDYLDQKYPDKYGIGQFPDFTHIDIRVEMARW
ncbi:MAG: D-Ala-D-Ala carboxypeptidase family metallohydrolase [Candidatus Thiodiazotropha sp.]|jgi:uncharacterized protein YcbK (DUF882 family)